jgi:1-pyrroline-5-carboxylate dehydrogenase
VNCSRYSEGIEKEKFKKNRRVTKLYNSFTRIYKKNLRVDDFDQEDKMLNNIVNIPQPVNEPVLEYKPGSPEREKVMKELDRQYHTHVEIPVIIGGKALHTGNTIDVVCPHQHGHVLGTAHQAGEKEIALAIEAALEAKKQWAVLGWQQRVSIFLKMADLITTKYRYILNASTMLNQSKSVHQAEIDATAEMADFLRFNAKYIEEIYSNQPESAPGSWNYLDYRPLDGFVVAISPFNFTSIAGNLATAPAMMGNTVLWKPSRTSLLSAYYLMELYREAGLPDGVINFIPCSGKTLSQVAMKHPQLSGIHFTGSTGVFSELWKNVAANLETYASYPRLVGETGGKDYIFMHNSADEDEVVTALVRGAFEYQGQKCSACSRAYIPASRWDSVKEKLSAMVKQIKMGDVQNFENFFHAVIDEKSFDSTMEYIQDAQSSADATVICGGNGDKSTGYFIEPTVIHAHKPDYITMKEELFAPVLTIYVYPDDQLEETLDAVEKTTPYALTGAIFARDRYLIERLLVRLRHTAGNFYINDKPTGAVVGQQPFGGSRASGTNDKAGSPLNLLRWTSPRTIKENFVPPTHFEYPYMKSN